MPPEDMEDAINKAMDGSYVPIIQVFWIVCPVHGIVENATDDRQTAMYIASQGITVAGHEITLN